MKPLPVGTRVITSLDRVGVVASPLADRCYTVRFSDGSQAVVSATEVRLYTAPPDGFPAQPAQDALRQYVIYSAVVGSTAYGLSQEGSDVDRRGIYLPPAHLHWSLAGVPEQLEFREREEVFWELEKFLRLALRSNPNVLECLYSPLVEHITPLAEELRDMRHIFLSRLAHQTYSAYVLSQFQKIQQDLRNRDAVRWKHVMHLLRLLLSGITVMRDGFVPLDVERHRERLLAVRGGEVEWASVERWRSQLQAEFDSALFTTSLPEYPDFCAADRFLVEARRYALELK